MILDQFRLTGQMAVVTGAGRGLGLAMAGALAEAGADIVSVARSSPTPALIERIESVGRRVWGIECDLSSAEDRGGLIRRAEQLAEVPVSILVNNAGITARHPPEEYPLDHAALMMEVHLLAAFDLCQQAAGSMLPRNYGKIINIGSVMSHQGGFNIPAYAAAKHAIAGLTKSLANAWAARGINVNCLCPGYFDTELAGPLQRDPVRGPQIMARIPAGRWAQPDELGGAIVFLASRASNYVHGSLLTVDGGWAAR